MTLILTVQLILTVITMIPGIILLPGSISGILSSPIPQRGPEDMCLMSFTTLMRLQLKVLRAADRCTTWSIQAQPAILLQAETKGRPDRRRDELVFKF